jgi:hypothetical protein
MSPLITISVHGFLSLSRIWYVRYKILLSIWLSDDYSGRFSNGILLVNKYSNKSFILLHNSVLFSSMKVYLSISNSNVDCNGFSSSFDFFWFKRHPFSTRHLTLSERIRQVMTLHYRFLFAFHRCLFLSTSFFLSFRFYLIKKQRIMATSETVRVIVRCRPMNQRELDLKCQVRWFFDKINFISFSRMLFQWIHN